MDLRHYDPLAALFAHPGARLAADVARARAAVADRSPKAARSLDELRRLLPTDDAVAVQELFTRTFDVQAITTLDIGYTLFGEDYKRGALLANLSNEHRQAGNDCSTELADHLPNVLRLLPRMKDAELREELVHVLLGPAVWEMIREFEPERIAKKEKLYEKHHKTILEAAAGDTRTAYRHALEAVYEVLRADFELKVGLPLEGKPGFAQAVGAEMGIEACDGCTTTPAS